MISLNNIYWKEISRMVGSILSITSSTVFYKKMATSNIKFDEKLMVLNIMPLEELGRNPNLGRPTVQGRARFRVRIKVRTNMEHKLVMES